MTMRKAMGLTGIVLAMFATVALAQNWPARPLKIVVPSAPGGGTDVFARLISASLTEALKQPFIVENRPGADGNIGTELAAKAAPDGYTILVSAIPAMIINPYLHKNLPYNAETDFVPVAPGVISPLVISVHPSVPANTLADLVAIGMRAPGTLAYGTPGSGSSAYLGVRMLEEASGARFLHVPYKGSGPAYQGLLSGDLQFMMGDIVSILPHIRSGKVRALAVTIGAKMLPDIPTVAQAGYKEFEVYASFMVVAVKGTPAAIVQRLNDEINKAMKFPANAQRLNALSLIPVFETPEQFAASLKKTRAAWSAFIQRNNIVSGH